VTQLSIRALAPIHTSIHSSTDFRAFGRRRDPTPTPKIRWLRANANPLANSVRNFEGMALPLQTMSALPSKADMVQRSCDVRAELEREMMIRGLLIPF